MLKSEAKKEYQREYMKKYMKAKRAVKTSDVDAMLDPVKTLLRPTQNVKTPKAKALHETKGVTVTPGVTPRAFSSTTFGYATKGIPGPKWMV